MDVATVEWAAQVADAVRTFAGFAIAVSCLGLIGCLIGWVTSDTKEGEALAFGIGVKFFALLACASAAFALVPSGEIVKLSAGWEYPK